PRLKRPVYKNNRIRPERIKVRKTNIMSMHKDYQQIDKLAKKFELRNDNGITEVSADELYSLQKNYFNFCQALCVFSIGHFNFTCKENKLVNFDRLSMLFKYKGWKIRLKKFNCAKQRLLSLTFKKDVEYKVIIIPSVFEDNGDLLDSIKAKVPADEYVVFSPCEETAQEATFVDITSIQSFRRIQQILLKGMVYSDVKRIECPFCDKQLTLNEQKSSADNAVYECLSCRTEIHDRVCPSSGKRYSSTRISGLAHSYIDDDSTFAKRKQEAQMYFRNITELNNDGEEICPICNGVHN
ncbi:MAG: hypothetical protein K2M64_03550, partial [Clostridia bacterium]|nr:hypothetical protein [Clostridia bacterium]